jgi:hypothetical protein
LQTSHAFKQQHTSANGDDKPSLVVSEMASGPVRSQLRRKVMTNKSKLILVAVAATLASVAPAFAQSFDPDLGTGNVLSFGSQALVARAEAPVRHQRIVRHRGGMDAFAMEPRGFRNSDDPTATGGGSIGYNENLYNY